MTAQQDVNELLKKKLKEELFLFGQEVENEDDENNENLLNIRNKVNSLLQDLLTKKNTIFVDSELA